MSDSLPTSSLFGRYSRYLPGLVGAGAGALASSFLGGLAADKAISRDSSRFVTWSKYRRPTPPSVPMKRPRAMTRRRVMRRYARRVSRFRRPSSDGFITIRRTCLNATGFAVVGSSNPTNLIFTFQLGYLPNINDFTALYSQYRIKKIQLKICCRNDFGNANGLGTTALGTSIPQIAIANDPAKTTPPATINDTLAYNNVRLCDLHGSRPIYHTIYNPMAANTVQGVNVSPMNSWLLTTNTGIPHYGVQFSWVTASTTIGIDVYATYTVQFKGRA